MADNDGSSVKDLTRYCVITPCRDEMDYLHRSVESVLRQSIPPAAWVIVDDGSTDGSSEALDKIADLYPWITIVHSAGSQQRTLGGGVIRAFDLGLRQVDLDQYEYVCKLDLDLDLPQGYFEGLILAMADDPRLASCSGKPFFRSASGAKVFERCGDENSVGMTKFYRVNAFREIGGFVPQVMWDGIDCHLARMKGWRVRSITGEHLSFEHLRPMGSSDRGILRGRRRHGAGQWYMGTDGLFLLASALSRVGDYPRFAGSANMVFGYVCAAAKRTPRFQAGSFRSELRRYQRESLFLGKARAVARWETRADHGRFRAMSAAGER